MVKRTITECYSILAIVHHNGWQDIRVPKLAMLIFSKYNIEFGLSCIRNNLKQLEVTDAIQCQDGSEIVTVSNVNDRTRWRCYRVSEGYVSSLE